MAVLIHVVIALASIVSTSLTALAPSRRRFSVSYGLIGLTLISGTWLALSLHTPMLQACKAGLLYLGVVLTGLAIARRRLARPDGE